ncbi:hypothetical protein [Plantactinospora endophytica]|uniref:Uncharacterized protein n=1 Tax=Plantactinospora endophytica TaxID=673535 RepID=A0ABQ4E9L9_9ACTN|nr:hypothetical protein [Plantactinospora endophytica]GIG91435.1 hypothetical protein Pen02_63710 [Plantactinospora endophytica]
MGVLAERLDDMRVRVSAPGGRIVAELRGRADVRLSFTPESYRYCDERELERQLEGLGKLLWAGRTREYYAAASEAFGATITGEPPAVSLRDQDFCSARDELVAQGRSSDGRIHLAVRGMRIWTVRVADGTVRSLTEEEFAARVSEAAGELIRDQFAKIRVLKHRVYG